MPFIPSIFHFSLKATFFIVLDQIQTTIIKMSRSMEQLQNSAAIFKECQYVRAMGSYKPHFEGIPEEYFPLTNFEAFKYSLYVILIIGTGLGIMIGFLFWVLNNGLANYTITWCIVFLVFVVVMIILFLIFGKSRIRQEKRLIAEQQEKQQKLMNKQNVKRIHSSGEIQK